MAEIGKLHFSHSSRGLQDHDLNHQCENFKSHILHSDVLQMYCFSVTPMRTLLILGTFKDVIMPLFKKIPYM